MMKKTLSSQQITFFRNNHFIELEGLISDADAEEYLVHVDQNTSFEEGRDLWKKDPWIKKLVMRQIISHCAKELFQQDVIRLAFDQYIVTSDHKTPHFHENFSLNEISSFQSLLGAVCLLLSPSSPQIESAHLFCPLPLKRGNGLFFSADLPLDLQTLFTLPNTSLLLIAYAPVKTLYIKNPNDPLTHLLKKDGYVFGDRLNYVHHPVLK